MPGYGLILTLTGGLSAALVFGYLTHRIGLSPIVGYLAAGLVVGPYTPGFVADAGLAEELAEVGVILLMFGVGLQFHLDELLAVRRTALPGALTASGVAALLGTLLARAFGWEWAGALVFGLALGVASTVVLVRVLSDHNHLHTPAGHLAVGWLVVEDLFTVVALVILPAVFRPAADGSSLWLALGVTALKVVGLVAFTALVGTRVIPKLLDYIARSRSRELFTLAILVIALSIAVGSAAAFSVSMALGAFLAGMIVGQSEFSFRAASDALPMRDAFAVLFFVSVGMLFDPGALMAAPKPLLATLAIVLIGKPVIAFLIVVLLKYGSQIGIGVAIALAQIGEFSLILSSVGDQLKILPEGATNLIVAASLVSLTLNPLLYRSIQGLNALLNRFPAVQRILNGRAPVSPATDEPQATAAYRAVVVGYGPIGQTVARLLHDGVRLSDRLSIHTRSRRNRHVQAVAS